MVDSTLNQPLLWVNRPSVQRNKHHDVALQQNHLTRRELCVNSVLCVAAFQKTVASLSFVPVISKL